MDKALAAATLIFLESIEWSKLIDGEHTNNCALKKLIGMYREILKDNGTE